MLFFEQVRFRQSRKIHALTNKVKSFASSRLEPADDVISCLLSGSLARGDYWPGSFGGAVDLIIFVRDVTVFAAEQYLGPDLEEHIPGHFASIDGEYYQIKIYDREYLDSFAKQDEAEKYAFFESVMLFDKSARLEKKRTELLSIGRQTEIPEKLRSAIGHIHYLLNEYKTDRWRRRIAVLQLHQNLSKAIELSINALYYANGLYCPAEDRALYYSFSLPIKPKNYDICIQELMIIPDDTLESYNDREALFTQKVFSFFE